MQYNIEIDSLKLWTDQNGLSKPFEEWSDYSKRSFNDWLLKNDKRVDIAKLRKSSSYEAMEPNDVRIFAEKLISYIDNEKPLALAMAEYEGGIYVQTVTAGDMTERVKEYVDKQYRNYVDSRFHSIQQYVNMNNDERYDKIFDVNTGKVIKDK